MPVESRTKSDAKLENWRPIPGLMPSDTLKGRTASFTKRLYQSRLPLRPLAHAAPSNWNTTLPASPFFMSSMP